MVRPREDTGSQTPVYQDRIMRQNRQQRQREPSPDLMTQSARVQLRGTFDPFEAMGGGVGVSTVRAGGRALFNLADDAARGARGLLRRGADDAPTPTPAASPRYAPGTTNAERAAADELIPANMRTPTSTQIAQRSGRAPPPPPTGPKPSGYFDNLSPKAKAGLGFAGIGGATLLGVEALDLARTSPDTMIANQPRDTTPEPTADPTPTPDGQPDTPGVSGDLAAVLADLFDRNNAPRPDDPSPADAILSPFLGLSDAIADFGAGGGAGLAFTGAGFGDLFSYTGAGFGEASANIGAGVGNAAATVGAAAGDSLRRVAVVGAVGALLLAAAKDKGIRKSVQGLDKPKTRKEAPKKLKRASPRASAKGAAPA